MRKKVSLPSGLEVEIKSPGPRAFYAIFGVLPDLTSEGSKIAEKDMQKNVEVAAKMIAACCVKPKYWGNLEEGAAVPEGYTDIDDLELDDFWALSAEINKLMEDAKANVRPLAKTATA